jgi:hypothetical protein
MRSCPRPRGSNPGSARARLGRGGPTEQSGGYRTFDFRHALNSARPRGCEASRTIFVTWAVIRSESTAVYSNADEFRTAETTVQARPPRTPQAPAVAGTVRLSTTEPSGPCGASWCVWPLFSLNHSGFSPAMTKPPARPSRLVIFQPGHPTPANARDCRVLFAWHSELPPLAMPQNMLGTISHELKVLRPVVTLVAVDVVNLFSGLQSSPKFSLHHETMLVSNSLTAHSKVVRSRNVHRDIPVGGSMPAPPPAPPRGDCVTFGVE